MKNVYIQTEISDFWLQNLSMVWDTYGTLDETHMRLLSSFSQEKHLKNSSNSFTLLKVRVFNCLTKMRLNRVQMETLRCCWVSIEKFKVRHTAGCHHLHASQTLLPQPRLFCLKLLQGQENQITNHLELKKHWREGGEESIAWVFAREAWNTIRSTLPTECCFCSDSSAMVERRLRFTYATSSSSPQTHRSWSVFRGLGGPLCPGSWIYTRIHGPGRPDPFDRQGVVSNKTERLVFTTWRPCLPPRLQESYKVFKQWA